MKSTHSTAPPRKCYSYLVLCLTTDASNSQEDEIKTEFEGEKGCSQMSKKKRYRSHFSQRQLKYLENMFSRQQYLSRDERALLANALEMTELQIRNWFQNRRYQKRHREQVQKRKEESYTTSCEEKESWLVLTELKDWCSEQCAPSIHVTPRVHAFYLT